MESEHTGSSLSAESQALLDHLTKVRTHVADDNICKSLGTDCSFVGSVILALTKPEEEIVNAALQLMYRLCEFAECRKTFFAVDGENNKALNRTLRELMAHGPFMIQEMANIVYDQMENHASQVKKAEHTPHKKSRNAQKKRRNSFFLGSVSDAKSIVLEVRGMTNKDDKDLLRQRLIHVKGIISIMVDDKRNRIMLKTKQNVKPQVIADAIRTTMTMTAEQVLRDENGVETLVSFKCPVLEEAPDYPSDDDSPVKGDKNLEIPGKSSARKAPSAIWGMLNSVAGYINEQVHWY